MSGILVLWDSTTFNSTSGRLEVVPMVAIRLLQTLTLAVGLELQNWTGCQKLVTISYKYFGFGLPVASGGIVAAGVAV